MQKPSSPWCSGLRTGALLGIPTTLVAIIAIGNIWSACDVGVNASADSFSLAVIAPPVWILTVFFWTLIYGWLGRYNRKMAAAFGMAFNLWLLWFLVARIGTLGSYPDPACPGDVPPWWPDFIPM
jgi:hypothetical protein